MIYTIYSTSNECIADGYDRELVIREAEKYLSNEMDEAGEYGSNYDDFILITYNEDTGIESTESITLHWGNARDTYDGGRSEYYATRL